jgi:hypothetical protein
MIKFILLLLLVLFYFVFMLCLTISFIRCIIRDLKPNKFEHEKNPTEGMKPIKFSTDIKQLNKYNYNNPDLT